MTNVNRQNKQQLAKLMQKKRKLTQKERREIVESVVGKIPWSKFTPGIFNYCDRWCEKCNKTEKCSLFWTTQKEEAEFAGQGIDTKSPDGSLKVVENSLMQTGELIAKIAEAEGLDLTITPEFETEFEKREKLTDHRNDPVYCLAHLIYRKISSWLNEVPSLEIKEYHEAYEKLSWHFLIINSKIARSVSGKKEANLETGDFKKFELQDSKKSAWVAYRSTKICAESLELIDTYVRDFRIALIARSCRRLLILIDQNLL